jgi:hypothetical protein
VAEGRGGRSSSKQSICLNFSTSPARYARRPLLFQEGSGESLEIHIETTWIRFFDVGVILRAFALDVLTCGDGNNSRNSDQ